MPFNSAYDISLRCTHFSNKAALYNDSIFQALCLNQIVCDIFEDVFIAVLRKYEYGRDFLWKQRTILETENYTGNRPPSLLCFELVSFTRKYMYNYLSPIFLSCFLEPKQSTLLHKAVNEKNGIS